jgi:hypothetical protein
MTRVVRFLMRPGVALFALAFASYAYFYQAGGWNQNSRFDLTRAIVEHGTVRIDRYEKNTGDEAKRDGHYYCDKAPGVSLLGVPVWAVVYAGAARPPRPEQLAIGAWLATVFAIGIPSALAVVALFAIARRLGARAPWAMTIAVGYGLATLAFPYATVYYGHQLVAALLVIAFELVQEGGASRSRFAAVGALLGLAVVVEYPAALAAIPIFVYAMRGAPWKTVVIGTALGAAIPAVVLAWYHTAAFGGPLTLPYEFSTQKHRHMGWFMGLGVPDLDVAWQILGSSYRGLFYSAPWLLLCVPGAVRLWRAGFREVVVACSAIVVLFVWLNASLVDWQGGWAMGPRYLIPAIPFMVVLAAGVVLPPRRAVARGLRIAGAATLGIALAFSTYMMVVGTSVKPEVPVHVRRPFQDYLLPRFSRGELAVSTQSIDMPSHPDRAPRQAFNVGHTLGLRGRVSLVPLALAWLACTVWIVLAIRRDQIPGRQDARSGVND